MSEIAHALADKLNADEAELLERIQKLGVTLDTGSAFILAPLAEIAWVDGNVSDAERETILRIGKQRGVKPGSADYDQLLDWLFEAAVAYFGIVSVIGFDLGIIRVVWVAPLIGLRTAELLEQPPILVAIFFPAKSVMHRLALGFSRLEVLGGLTA